MKHSHHTTPVTGAKKDVDNRKVSQAGTLVDKEKAQDPEKTSGMSPEKRENASKYEQDDPFGDESNSDVKYKTMDWWHATVIMIAETVSLGILSLPSVLAGVGLVPGIILIAALGLIATYTGYTIWQFKMAYPHVHNMADAGEVLAGPIGRELGGAAQTIFLIFSMGSHVLTFTIALNAISQHATCTLVWGVVALVVLWICTLPRTLKKVSYLSVASFISITSAVFITMIGAGIEKPIGNGKVVAVASVSFASGFFSVTNIVFAYAGHVAFFTFISELKNPKDFPKALYLLQIFDTTLYIIVAVVVYRYTGNDVKSPALGSTSKTVMRVAYGIALPTIIIAGVIYGHVASKYIYVRMFRGTRHMGSKTFLGVGTWLAITLTIWVIAFVIAESIPNFNDLLALISSLFASWFTYGISGIFWLFLNKGKYFSSPKRIMLTIVNWLMVLMGAVVMGLGMYASVVAIKKDGGSGSWSCADNSNKG